MDTLSKDRPTVMRDSYLKCVHFDMQFKKLQVKMYVKKYGFYRSNTYEGISKVITFMNGTEPFCLIGPA